jgi:hypothetical protein
MFQFLCRELRQELLPRLFIMVPFIGPEQFCEIRDALVQLGVDFAVLRHHGLEHIPLAQPKTRKLIVENRIDSNRRLREPISKRLLPRRQVLKATRLYLDESRRVNALD